MRADENVKKTLKEYTYSTRAVAQYVISSAILLMRQMPTMISAGNEAEWSAAARQSHEIWGQTFGIIGYGKIGRQLSVYAEVLGFDVIYYDFVPKLAIGNSKQVDDLNELLSKSDVVSIHLPNEPSTHRFFGETEFQQLREGSIFINTVHGDLMSEPGFMDALLSNRLKGSALDFKLKDAGFSAENRAILDSLPNVILSPNCSGLISADFTPEPIKALSKMAPRGVFGKAGSSKISTVIYVHDNKPGALFAVSNTLDTAGIRVFGQVLETRNDEGTLTIDIPSADAQDAVTLLGTLSHAREVNLLTG